MKLKPITLSIIMACSLSACTNSEKINDAYITKVEEVNTHTSDISILYTKYRLENGLTVLIHEDHSDPLVHVNVTYHVGSSREELGKSGYAHLFEHMMFQGSKHVADEEHFKIVTESGGRLSGVTNSDTTRYYQTIPANQLEKILWLEADRMGFFSDGITQEKFEIQRDAVKNERAMRMDNVAYGRVRELAGQTLYDYGHPYSWPVIGYMSDLNNASSNDLKGFFKKWYGPNNATLIVGGAVNAKQVLTLVNQYFGTLPKSEEVKALEKQPAKLTSNRYSSYEDNIQFPLIQKLYPTIHASHLDKTALDALAYFMGQGKSSILAESLINTQHALQVNVSHDCRELACEFTYTALPHPINNKQLSDMELALDEGFEQLFAKGITQVDIDKYIIKTEAELLRVFESVEGKVRFLSSQEILYKKGNYLQHKLSNLRALKVSDIHSVYKTYIEGKAAAVVSVVPVGKQELVAHKDNHQAQFYISPSTATSAKNTISSVEIQDSFDRSIKPKAAPAKPVIMPKLSKGRLTNGVEVLLAKNTETPTTSLLLKIPAGSHYDPKGQSLVSNLVADMLGESTLTHSAAELTDKLNHLGSTLSINATDDSIEVYISALSKNLEPTLAILKDKLTAPLFDQGEFLKVKSKHIQYYKHAMKDADFLADNSFKKLLYGETNFGRPSLNEISSITKENVMGYYNKQIKPLGSQLVVVSNLSSKQLMPQIEKALKDWQGKPQLQKMDVALMPSDNDVIYLIDKPDAAQAQIRIGKISVPFDATGEFYKSQLMNFAFSGSFNSRLMLNLREDKGYTYGTFGQFIGKKETGQFIIKGGIKPNKVALALLEINKELEGISKKGFVHSELEYTKNSIAQREALKYETPIDKLRYLSKIQNFNSGSDVTQKQSQVLKKLTLEDINSLAKKYFQQEQMVKVVVGDKKRLIPQLTEAGFKVQEYTL